MANEEKGRILVVDDNDANLLVATAILENLGYSFDIAKDGMGAVERYAKEKYIIILMDIHMPEMSGYEATQQIRAYELRNELPRTPILVITANPDFMANHTLLANSIDGFIIKPYQQEELLNMITAQCDLPA